MEYHQVEPCPVCYQRHTWKHGDKDPGADKKVHVSSKEELESEIKKLKESLELKNAMLEVANSIQAKSNETQRNMLKDIDHLLKIRNAAKELQAKILKVYKDPEYISAFSRIQYGGETWVAEFVTLENLLKEKKEQ